MNIRKTINFLRLRKFFYVVAVALMLASVGSLAVKQLNLGLDFTGGALVELNYSEAADLEAIRATLRENGWGDAVVQNFGASTDVLIRLPSDDPNLGNQVAQMIKTTDGSDVSVKRVEFIGPQVGEELRDQGGLGMLVAIAGILLYVSALRDEVRGGGDSGAGPRRDLYPRGVLVFRDFVRLDGARGDSGSDRLLVERHHRGVRPGA